MKKRVKWGQTFKKTLELGGLGRRTICHGIKKHETKKENFLEAF